MTRPLSEKNYDELCTQLDKTGTVDMSKLTPAKPKKKRNNEESREQRQVVRWWDLVGARRFKLNHTLLHSVPNGGFRSVVTASIMKAEGQRRGVFDIKLNVGRKGKLGFWLEMKAEKGSLSKEQVDFQKAVEEQGYATSICRSTEEAIREIENYLS